MEIKDALSLISKGVNEKAFQRGFSLQKPEGFKGTDCPVFTEDKEQYILYQGGKGFIKISMSDKKAFFMTAPPVNEGEEPQFKSVSVSQFDESTADDSDLKYIINEYNDCIEDSFVFSISKGISDVKLPPPVSKAAAKNGSSFYDPNTLANRYTVMFPELRDEFKKNIDTYGQFLPDDFFTKFGYAAIDVIKKNEKQQMKKLFNMFNDIYLDGTNETQSLIVVTILGQLENDTELLANCVDYMDPELASAVINVNKYLASRGGKNARYLLVSPPRYKPPKKKGMKR